MRACASRPAPLPGFAVIDTLSAGKESRLPAAPNHRLDILAWILGLDQEGAHRALADSLRVKQIWICLKGAEDGFVSFPLFDPSEPLPPPRGWESLAEAILGERRVRMEYAGGTRGCALREITPRRFVHKGGIAYVVAFCHVDNLEKSFRLDRVVRYEVAQPVVAERNLDPYSNGTLFDL